ncbi:polyprenyl synthetase family protein [Symbioplanes lichenis]|uniref:polyprenyl synthetase family protein n=1 Tax=Symbioplanes lichenis TaxID=1629072 RepID=UPI0027391062|nr:polyprenyl synthetase family protein [Actinoplanes lichenis]
MTVESPAGTGSAELARRCEAALIAYLDRQRPHWPDGTPRGVLDAVRRFVLADGKRLRPMFCYWGWRGAGGPDSAAIVTAAAALELFHAFALIHDDIMDGSATRRGRPTVHRHFADVHTRHSWKGEATRYGHSAALLCGDLCAAWADHMFHESGLPIDQIHRGYRLFTVMRTEVIAGQYLDLVSAVGDGSVAGALTVIRMKAARYTVTRPLQIGAALAGAGLADQAALQAFGDPLGDAFQLRDDVLGVFGDPAVTGKPVIDDLREGKPTVMVAMARDRASRPQAGRLRELFGSPALDEAGAAELRDIITSTGAREATEDLIAKRAAAARTALALAPLTPDAREALGELVASVVARTR